MNPLLVNIFLSALLTCNARATHFSPDVSPIEIAMGYVSAGTAWQPGFERCATVAPYIASRLRTYFAAQIKAQNEKSLQDDKAALVKAEVALGGKP